jgi:beta-lactamase regulating signal transducer with metallopeptidase domain
MKSSFKAYTLRYKKVNMNQELSPNTKPTESASKTKAKLNRIETSRAFLFISILFFFVVVDCFKIYGALFYSRLQQATSTK